MTTTAYNLLGTQVPITAAGATLLDDADTAAQRTTLGLGTAATTAASAYATAAQGATADAASAAVAKAPQWRKYTVTFTQLATAGLTNTVELFSLPAKGVIHAVIANPTVAFSGGLIASYTISVGIVGTVAKYCTAISVAAAAVQTPQALIGVESMSGATSIKITAVSTVANLDQASQGSVDVYVLWSTMP